MGPNPILYIFTSHLIQMSESEQKAGKACESMFLIHAVELGLS